MDAEKRDERLKHLGFVRVVAIRTLICLSNLYDYAKNKAGPLQPAVATVEGAVTAVVGPVCHKFMGVPDELLVFLDEKVDVATTKFDEHGPPVAKRVASHVHCIIMKATQTTQELIRQAQVGGPSAAAHYAASESKEFVFSQTVKVWTKLDRFPPFHMMAEIAVPTAAHLSDMYNKLVTHMSVKGCPAFSYLPLIPLDDIASAFKQADSNTRGDNVAQPPREEVATE